jgi:hypothetical protein
MGFLSSPACSTPRRGQLLELQIFFSVPPMPPPHVGTCSYRRSSAGCPSATIGVLGRSIGPRAWVRGGRRRGGRCVHANRANDSKLRGSHEARLPQNLGGSSADGRAERAPLHALRSGRLLLRHRRRDHRARSRGPVHRARDAPPVGAPPGHHRSRRGDDRAHRRTRSCPPVCAPRARHRYLAARPNRGVLARLPRVRLPRARVSPKLLRLRLCGGSCVKNVECAEAQQGR